MKYSADSNTVKTAPNPCKKPQRYREGQQNMLGYFGPGFFCFVETFFSRMDTSSSIDVLISQFTGYSSFSIFRFDHLHLGWSGNNSRRRHWTHMPCSRRMQRKWRVWKRHLHLSPIPDSCHWGMHQDGTKWRLRYCHLFPKGRKISRRSNKVLGLQHAKATGGRRLGRKLLQLHRTSCR